MNNFSKFLSNRRLSAPTMLIISSLIMTTYLANPSVSVIINGEFVGTVASKSDFENGVKAVETAASSVLESPYKLDIDKEYIFSYGNYANHISETESEKILTQYVSEIGQYAVIKVNGQVLAATRTVQDAQSAIDAYIVQAVGETDAELATVVEDIEIVEELADIQMLKSTDQIVDMFFSPEKEITVHKVTANQTLSEIAMTYGLKTSEVFDLNPDVDATRIQVGQNIVVEAEKPTLSVEVTKQLTYVDNIQYGTITEYSNSMTTSQKKTTTVGVYGTKEVVADVTYINGEEVERTILSETTLTEPKSEVVVVGTQIPVSTGSFMRPASGTLSSNYGYRSSGFHTGIDIANSYGTAIYAADGGTVTFAGWNGGYGYCIIINHGNGLETLYAHCSSLLVSKGAVVGKGQQIAKMGSTGNSTGNHLHFEVRKNGIHQNPNNYL